MYGLDDKPAGIEEKLLISATSLSFEGLWELVRSYGGVMFPAHIDKNANSLIANLGFIADDSLFTAAELHDIKKLHGIREKNPYLDSCRILVNSDAHYLEDIREPEFTIPVRERTAAGVVEALLTRP